jgi:hypothetical protein
MPDESKPAPKANTPYVAVKVKGFNHFIWFERFNIVDDGIFFCGVNGWAQGGALTHLNCESSAIEARIESDTLQHDN